MAMARGVMATIRRGSAAHNHGTRRVVNNCPVDINGDGVVDAADLGILIGQFGTVGPAADINGDDAVDTADLGILIGAFGATCP
jgi:uncharacterized protein (DUF2141 family)